MKESMLEYKGYHTVVRYNATDGTLRGIIEGINDYVDFQTTCIADVEKEFHCAVDDYLIFCEKVGKKTEKKYKGTFNVRIKPALHMISAYQENTLSKGVVAGVSPLLRYLP